MSSPITYTVQFRGPLDWDSIKSPRGVSDSLWVSEWVPGYRSDRKSLAFAAYYYRYIWLQIYFFIFWGKHIYFLCLPFLDTIRRRSSLNVPMEDRQPWTLHSILTAMHWWPDDARTYPLSTFSNFRKFQPDARRVNFHWENSIFQVV